jgi:hypothetical protein
MICPSCGSEYREGYQRCAECNVDLIHPETTSLVEGESENELTRVLETRSHDLLINVSLALEDRNIPYLAQSGTAFDASGVVEQGQNLSWRGALWVPESYQEDAEEIIDEVESQLRQAEAGEPQE